VVIREASTAAFRIDEAIRIAALEKAWAFKGLTFIEVILDRTDCNKALLGWGTAVADYNAGKGTINS
jgi:hypothetical protein